MSSNVSNLGRAYCKVVLYEKLPNLVVDTTKLRKSWFFALSMQLDKKIYDRTNFGVQYIGIKGSDGNESGGLMPAICYEPIDNYMDSTTTSTARKVVWHQMDWNAIKASTRFEFPGQNLPIANMFFSLIKEDPETPIPSNQTWTNSEKTIYTYRYSENDYQNSVNPPQTSSSSTTTSPSGTSSSSSSSSSESSTSSSGATATEVETKSYVYQQNGGIGSWWGATTEPFKLFGGGFWVSVFAQPAFVSNDPDQRKTSWICIRFNKDGALGGGNDSPYFLLISNRGQTFVRYLLNGRITDVPVNMGHLSEAFNRGEEIRVGLFTLGSRLIVYTDQYRYDSVNFRGKVTIANSKVQDQPYANYIFRTKIVEVYGYGCSAYVNVSEMTFFKKAWMVLDINGDDNFIGRKSPEYDTSGVVAGTWADGSLIAWNIGQEQYTQNSNFPMYAAQFGYYLEFDEVDNTTRPVCRCNLTAEDSEGDPENTAHASGCVNFGMYNCFPKWGKILIKRSKPVKGVANANFWYVFFYTEDVQDDILGEYKERVAFPVLYNFFGKIDFDSLANTGETMESFSSLDVTDDVMSVDINSQLDTPDKFSTIIKTATVNLYDEDGDYSKYLTRARGIKIWLKWSTNDTSDIDPDVDTPTFTGIAFGDKYSMRPGIDTISLNCSDYWSIAERMMIKNSPFYDGFELVSVIRDLAERVGIFVEDDVDHAGAGFYYLGSGFAFDKPMHRYQPNDNLKECMMKAIQMFPYYLWFDNQCILHVSIVPADFDWGQTGTSWDDGVYKYYYRDLDPIPHNHPEKLILNEISLTSSLSSSVFNSFYMQGVRRINNEAITVTGSRPDSILDPDAIGFLGYVAEKEHKQPAVDDNSVWIYLNRLMKMFSKPGYQTEIQTVGHVPPFRCGQFIKILQTPANDRGKFRVTAIGQQYDAEKNSWYTKITAYQIEQVLWSASVPPTPTLPP